MADQPRAGKLRVRPDVKAFREEAFRACEAVGERYFTAEALEGCVKSFAVHIVDLADYIAHLEAVAHRAWHLMDDSGETDATDDNGVPEYTHSGLDHQRLSDALDTLEANGWEAHHDE